MDAAEWVALARLVRPQGRRGEIVAELLTDFPERFGQRKRLFLMPPGGENPGGLREVALESHWLHQGRVVLKFAGVESIADADRLRGLTVVIPRSERAPLEAEAAYVGDLLGARIVDISRGAGQDVGEIADVLPEGVGPAILVVLAPDGEELMIPFVKAYLRRIDLDRGRIEMALPEGLTSMQAPLTEEERKWRMEDDPL